MKACDVKEMLKSSYEDPCFFINFHNVGRGLIGDSDNKSTYIKNTKILNCWRIVDNNLRKVDEEYCGILFDAEAYLFRWTFEYIINDTTEEDTLFYYWKGANASKGYSPLPPDVEDQNPVVERICQWSEPALFFHMLPRPLIVFSGTYEKFNPSTKRLFMLRGELPSEVHLYEVPCSKESLRSRGIFLLVNSSEKTIYYWYGSCIPKKHEQLGSLVKLNTRNKNWTNYKEIEIKDGYENDSFFKLLEGENRSYIRLPQNIDFTPRLFYFYSNPGELLAAEVEYPLRSKQHNAAFPFLQSHLYTADQPALFLLDNDKEIWLWEGWKTPDSNIELHKENLELTKETANNYAKEKGSVPIKHVLAGLEPLEFINIFPYWNMRNDVTKIQLQ